MQRRLLDQFKTRERASVVGAILGLTWVAYRATPIVFGHRELTPQEIGGAIGGALGCLLVSLWVWGMTDFYGVLDERREEFEDVVETDNTIGGPIFELALGGLDAALRALPGAIGYLVGWPLRRTRLRNSRK